MNIEFDATELGVIYDALTQDLRRRRHISDTSITERLIERIEPHAL